MFGRRLLCCTTAWFAVPLLVGVFSNIAAAQAARPPQGKPAAEEPLPWTFDVQTDKMTDQRTLTAISTVRLAPGSPYIYRLTLRCDGREGTATVGAWTTKGAPAGQMLARPIPFEVKNVTAFANRANYASVRQVRYRQDGKDVSGFLLEPTESENIGAVELGAIALDNDRVIYTTDLGKTVKGMTREQAVAFFGPASSETGTQLVYEDVARGTTDGPIRVTLLLEAGKVTDATVRWHLPMLTIRTPRDLPATRWLLADVFPEEVVEFPFSVLSSDERRAILKMCFPSQK